MTFWPNLIRCVNYTQGSMGILFNVYIIVLLWIRKFGSSARAYRVFIMYSSVNALLFSFLVPFFASAVHLFHFDTYMIVMYGAAVSSSEFIQQICLFTLFFGAYSIWEIVPAASLLQYLALSRPHLSIALKLVISFGTSALMIAWTFRPCLYFYPSPDFDQIAMSVHNLSADDPFLAFGALFQSTSEHSNSILQLGMEILPTYLISYVIFAACVFSIRRLLNIGIQFSPRTLKLQRDFLVMMVLQTLMPLLIFAIPISLYVYTLAVGTALDKFSLAISFSTDSIPSAQALVHLRFILKSGTKGPREAMSNTKSILVK